MKIELYLKLDNPTQKPFWCADIKDGDNIVMQVVSKTFEPKEHKAYELAYENVTVRVIKELSQEKNQNIVKHLLINQ
jgi:hypothetical protein